MSDTEPGGDPSGEVAVRAWDELCAAVRDAGRLVLDDASPAERAEGIRYLTRLLAAGAFLCVEHADGADPALEPMVRPTVRWGLDAPDCLYLYAAVSGDGRYRLHGTRGDADHLDIQVNRGHFSSGDLSEWTVVASANDLELDVDREGRFELTLGGEPTGGDWLPLDDGAEYLLIRQYFGDWDVEPAALSFERLDVRYPRPPPSPDELARRVERFVRWLGPGADHWDELNRAFLAGEPNTVQFVSGESSVGLAGQAYGLGGFRCDRGEAVVLEWEPPPCRYWGVSLADRYWQSIEYTTHQSSLNHRQAQVDDDGTLRLVVAHEDPGVPNWLDPLGHEHGTLAVRVLRPEAEVPALRAARVPVADVRRRLPSATPTVAPDSRHEALLRRRRGAWRRFRP